jgi:hydrogenase maturation protein HypF
VALALLWEVYGEAALAMDNIAAIRSFSQAERRVLGQMLRDGVRSPLTTSAGRLFDGVAALLGLGGEKQVSFEGQAAMALEYAASQASPTNSGTYTLPIAPPNAQRDSPLVLDWRSMVEAIMHDLQRDVAPSSMALRFHHALVQAMLAVAQAAGEQHVALTGGCFQNRILTEQAAQRLRGAGFTVLLHRQVPPNDGGICLGQIATAAAQMQEPQSYS